MKNLILSVLLFITTIIYAQVPQGINYQTIVRNNSGEVISNQNVSLRFSIRSGSPTGTISYSETHNTSTNTQGIINLIVGQGAPTSGSFSNVNWSSASHFLTVELDPQGGANFQTMGTSQLMSVPYALSAGSTNTSMAQLTDVEVSGVADGQVLQWSVSQQKWIPGSPSGGGAGDNWGSQTVQSNNTLSGEGTDTSPLQIAQQSATSGQVLKWSGTTWAPAQDLNTDEQTLSLSGNTLSISNGNSVNLPSGNTNTWNLTGNTGTNPANNFIGTTDDQPLNIRLNNQQRFRFTQKGQIEVLNTGGSIFIGENAGNNNLGLLNVSIGDRSMQENTTGDFNVAVGYQCLRRNISGSLNVAVGEYALNNNNTGWENTAVGRAALEDNTIGQENTAIGASCLHRLTTGSFNTAIGFQAGIYGQGLITGNYNTLVGYGITVDNSNRNNIVIIGGSGGLNSGGNNRVRIGNSSTSSIGGQVGWTNLSDARIKQNVNNNVVGLDFILKLKPLTYNYNVEVSNQIQGKEKTPDWDGKYDIEKIKFSGFMAQQVEQAAREANYDFSGVDKPEDDNGLWGLRYAEFTVPLVKAVQEQQAIIEKLQEEIEILKSLIK